MRGKRLERTPYVKPGARPDEPILSRAEAIERFASISRRRAPGRGRSRSTTRRSARLGASGWTGTPQLLDQLLEESARANVPVAVLYIPAYPVFCARRPRTRSPTPRARSHCAAARSGSMRASCSRAAPHPEELYYAFDSHLNAAGHAASPKRSCASSRRACAPRRGPASAGCARKLAARACSRARSRCSRVEIGAARDRERDGLRLLPRDARRALDEPRHRAAPDRPDPALARRGADLRARAAAARPLHRRSGRHRRARHPRARDRRAAAGHRHLVGIGDSHLFGWGVAWQDTFLAQIGARYAREHAGEPSRSPTSAFRATTRTSRPRCSRRRHSRSRPTP